GGTQRCARPAEPNSLQANSLWPIAFGQFPLGQIPSGPNSLWANFLWANFLWANFPLAEFPQPELFPGRIPEDEISQSQFTGPNFQTQFPRLKPSRGGQIPAPERPPAPSVKGAGKVVITP